RVAARRGRHGPGPAGEMRLNSNTSRACAMIAPSWIRRLFARTTRTVRRAPARRRSRPALEILEDRVLLSVFTVDRLGETGAGSGNSGDLRYCIVNANSNNQANTIQFDATVFATHQTITLGGTQLELTDTGGTQTITGPAAGVTIDAAKQSRVLFVHSNVTASLSGLTLSGGKLTQPSGLGGDLFNQGTANLTGCSVSSGRAAAGRGGLTG